QPISAGAGAKGQRIYDWALVAVNPTSHPRQHGQHWLLIRRHCRTGERAYYRCWTPRPVPLAALVRVAGTRWTVEEDFQTGKGLTPLREPRSRPRPSGHPRPARALPPPAFLPAPAATEHAAAPPPTGQIQLTRNEISHLLAVLTLAPTPDLRHRLHWSTWRR